MDNEEKIIERMTRLLLKGVFGKLRVEEQNELNIWLENHPSGKVWYEGVISLKFMKHDYRLAAEITETQQAWQRLERDMHRKNLRLRWKWACSAAAMLFIVFSSVFLLKREVPGHILTSFPDAHETALISLIINDGKDSIRLKKDKNFSLAGNRMHTENNTLIYDTVASPLGETGFHTLVVGRGGEYRLTLPDGTVVWLNSESSLRYPVRYTGTRRVVELQGEAFFRVKPDAERPFEVKGGEFNVVVLGTSFNIMNYKDEQCAQITLVIGKVQVNKGGHSVVIRPDQQVQLSKDRFEIRDVSSRYYASWIENKFMFDDEPLEVIIRKLARWYNLSYEFEDVTLKNTRFSGQLFKYDDITKAFELLEMTTDVDFTIDRKTILIMRKKR